MFNLPTQYGNWLPLAIILAAWMLFMLTGGWLMQRRLESKFKNQMREADQTLAETRQFQKDANARAEDTKARAVESFARQERMLEIAEQSMLDRQEMLAVLRRIADLLESRA